MTDRLAPQILEALGNELLAAERDRVPIEPLTDTHPDMTAEDAYGVQQAIVRARMAGGETIIGWKVGLTSEAMRKQLGVDSPDYGALLTGHVLGDGSVAHDALIAPRAEAEIAFLLHSPLSGPGVTTADVIAATEHVAAAIEVIDSRVEGWRIKLPDTIADMASCARIVVSDRRIPIADVDPASIRVRISKNGEQVSDGIGAAVLGDPAAAVAWVANTLAPLGVTLGAGDIIMPGAMHASVPVAAGDEIVADFDELGPVTVRFA